MVLHGNGAVIQNNLQKKTTQHMMLAANNSNSKPIYRVIGFYTVATNDVVAT
jgi:hypothetical protein